MKLDMYHRSSILRTQIPEVNTRKKNDVTEVNTYNFTASYTTSGQVIYSLILRKAPSATTTVQLSTDASLPQRGLPGAKVKLDWFTRENMYRYPQVYTGSDRQGQFMPRIITKKMQSSLYQLSKRNLRLSLNALLSTSSQTIVIAVTRSG